MSYSPGGLGAANRHTASPVSALIAYTDESGSAEPSSTSGLPCASTPYATGSQVPDCTLYFCQVHSRLQSLALIATTGPLAAALSLVPMYSVCTPPGGVATSGEPSISCGSEVVHPSAPLEASSL